MSVTRKIWPQIASRVATARPMSVAAVTSPYPKVVRVVNEKYCRSVMLGSATCTNNCWSPRSAMAPYTALNIRPSRRYAERAPQIVSSVTS